MFKDLTIKEWILLVVTTIILGSFFFLHQFHEVSAFFSKPNSCTDKSGSVITVEMLDATFSPDIIHASICDTLVLTNTSHYLHEPAVGPHPAHDSYPEFDAKRPLAHGESFSLQLKRSGEYSFHDHLNEKMIGKITIYKL